MKIIIDSINPDGLTVDIKDLYFDTIKDVTKFIEHIDKIYSNIE